MSIDSDSFEQVAAATVSYSPIVDTSYTQERYFIEDRFENIFGVLDNYSNRFMDIFKRLEELEKALEKNNVKNTTGFESKRSERACEVKGLVENNGGYITRGQIMKYFDIHHASADRIAREAVEVYGMKYFKNKSGKWVLAYK